MAAPEIKPIRTKRDNEASLKAIERLWGAKAGTPEGDRLDVLAPSSMRMKTEHYPMDPPDPIEAINFRMEQQGLTRKDLEEIIGTRKDCRGPEPKARAIDHDDPTLARTARHLGKDSVIRCYEK